MPASMTPERWQQVKSVFHRVRELAPEERSSFLDQACSTDHSLRREVESLLSSDDEARSAFLGAETTQVTLVEGTKLGDYEVQSLLGSGGMGMVYRARDSRLGREVAIKVLPPLFASDRNRMRRFEQEARAAAALNHPNILAVYQLGTYEGSPYLVSELLRGETLRAWLKRGPIRLEEALEYARQIARGLAAAHEKGIVHRDLKPENLFLTKDGQVKILDFGLAKQTRPELAETKSAGLATEAGVVMGTVGYMSPEQVRGQRADFRSDIFAFGAILYEMLSGQRAFTGESSADVASAILKEDPPRLSRSDSYIPKTLEAVVRRCLEKNPDDRFQSVEELTTKLHEIELPTVKRVSVAHIWPRVRWGWQRAACVAVLATVTVAVFTSVRYFHGREAPIDSIAVMPFVGKGTDANNDFGDGITAGLIDRLSQIPNLRVMARSAVSHYRGQEIDPRKVGRELNVHAVLTGTLMAQADSFVLETELVNTTDDSHLWGDRYSAKASDILTLQADLARAISEKLRPRLASETKAKLAYQGTSYPEAYSLYVKGLYAFDGLDAQHTKEALAYFQQAIEKDPSYAQAYGGLGVAYANQAHNRAMEFREGIQKAKAAAHRALELDPNLAEGHCALGLASHIAWEWEEAERESRRCVELNQNLFIAHQLYALILADRGKMAQAIAEQNLAMKLDPLSFTGNHFLANVYYFARDYNRSIEQRLKTIEREPYRPWQHSGLADCYARKGEYDKAALEYEKDLENEPNQAEALRRAYAKEGFPGLLKAQIQQWENPQKVDDYSPADVAKNYSLLGDRENAFLWLDRAYADNEKQGVGNGSLIVTKIAPEFDNIRSDPRFNAFLRHMGFQE